MGSKILSTDMIVGQMLMPMQNAYYHGDYQRAALGLYGLAQFLYGFKEGIEGFPRPPRQKVYRDMDSRTSQHVRMRFVSECARYYEDNYPVVMLRLGQYQRAMLDSVERNRYKMGDDEETEQEEPKEEMTPEPRV